MVSKAFGLSQLGDTDSIRVDSANNILQVTGSVRVTENVAFDSVNAVRLSEPSANTLTIHTAGSERLRVDSSGRLGIGTDSPAEQFHMTGNLRIGTAVAGTPSGNTPLNFCRAWVNFNGTGTVAIRSQNNVSSITDGGTGQYTVNLTTAMTDVNGSALAVTDTDTGTQHSVTTSILSASTVRVRQYVSSAFTDGSSVYVAIFR